MHLTKVTPLVSIVIPTFKRSDYLIRAIESVRRQTYKNIEIIVVDDNKSESIFRKETEKKLDKYIVLKQIKYIKNPENIGGALARNRGIEEASGEYIAFLDDDDIYLESKIESQIEFMLLHDFDMSFSNVAIVNIKGELIDYREHLYIKEDSSNRDLLKYHLMFHLTPTGTYMYKKNALLGINSFDEASVGQEFRLMLKTIQNKLKIGYHNETHVVQFVHDGERISVGQNKIIGEKQIFELKSQFFPELQIRDIRYIKFRYRAVLTVVGLRSKRLLFASGNGFLALLSSPTSFFEEIYKQMRKITKHKDIENQIKIELETIEALL